MSEPQILFSRDTDRAATVHVLDQGYQVIPAPGVRLGKVSSPEIYKTARQLLVGLTGHPKGRNWTFDRYFKIGKHTPPAFSLPNLPPVPVTELLGTIILAAPSFSPDRFSDLPPGVNAKKVLDQALAAQETFFSEGAIFTTEGIYSTTPRIKLGIDLKNRGHEVAKLLFAGFGRKIYGAGYDPEDVLQEVYQGLLVRNRGKCPWDERKASFGHYVHIVCSCILSNYHRRMNRRRSVEQVGLYGYNDGCRVPMDVATVAESKSTLQAGIGAAMAEADLRGYIQGQPSSQSADGQLALTILPLVHKGWRRAELADHFEVNRAAVSRALTYLRRQAQAWAG